MSKSLRLIIMPTEQCNFRCQYCYESFKFGKMSLEMQDAIINFVRKNIYKYTEVHLDWYGGEPLLAFDVIQYISENVLKICKCAKKPLITSVTTNGYFLTLDVYKKLQSYNLVNIQVTIDGLKKTHDRQRVLADGKPTYDVILNNLLEIKNKTKSGIAKIIIRTNVTKDIFNNFTDYIDFYYNCFGDDKRFSFLIRPVGDWGGEAVHQIEEQLMNKNAFSQVYTKIIQKNKLNLSFYENYFEPAGSICYAGIRNSFIIRANGKINKCTCDLDSEINDIGKLLPNGDMELDINKHAKWICLKERSECFNCNFFGSCVSSNCPMKMLGPKEFYTCGYEKVYLIPTLIMLSRSGIIKELKEEALI